MKKKKYMVTDVELDNGSEVCYEYIFKDLSKDEDDQEFEEYGTWDAQELVLRNQERFIFDEKPSVEVVADIFYEIIEYYTDKNYVNVSDFNFENEEDIFFTGKCSVYICPEVIDYEFEEIEEG